MRLFTREIRLDMASWVFSCVLISYHQALKDASGKHKTFTYLTKISRGPSGSETMVVKTYYPIQKLFRSLFVEILAEWDLNIVGTTGFAYVNSAIQKPGSSQTCPETFSVYSYSSVLFFLTM
jgi:hypothetical protein